MLTFGVPEKADRLVPAVRALNPAERRAMLKLRTSSDCPVQIWMPVYLSFEVGVEAFSSAFTSGTGCFVCERCGRVADHSAVDTGHAGVQCIRDTKGPLQVLGEHV